MHGILNLSWWGYIVATVILTQITIVCVTVYLHRCQSHRALELHPIASHFFRFWLWMTTGMVTKEWVSIHRKHHAKVETDEDPHSPVTKGIWKVLLEGTELYRKEARNKETLERYGQGTPNDWVEKNVYSKFGKTGLFSMLGIDILLFGPIGITIWAIQLIWIPLFAAGVINGLGHYVGYRNFECPDASRNLLPIGWFVGGEELHNNHHTFGTSAKFSVKWWEFDLGWGLIRLMQMVGLASPRQVPLQPKVMSDKRTIDIDTVKALITNRFQVMAAYSRKVIMPVLREETNRASEAGKSMLSRARKLLVLETSLMDQIGLQRLTGILENYRSLQVVYQFRMKLQNIWAKSTATQTELLAALQEWCHQAEAAGISALSEFVNQIKGYVPHKA